MKIEGLILAGGSGHRMGHPKALTPWQDGNFLQMATRALKSSGKLSDIHIVLGAKAGEILREMESPAAAPDFAHCHAIVNEEFATGVMSSLQAGVRAVTADIDALLVMLVDLPLLQQKTLNTFLSAAESEFLYNQKTLARPYVLPDLTPGHPCLIHRVHFAEILMQPKSDRGASFLFDKYSNLVFRFTTRDQSVAHDVDTQGALHFAQDMADRGPI